MKTLREHFRRVMKWTAFLLPFFARNSILEFGQNNLRERVGKKFSKSNSLLTLNISLTQAVLTENKMLNFRFAFVKNRENK